MLNMLRLVPISAWAIVAALAWGAVQRHHAKTEGARALAAEKALADIRADAAQLALQTAARTAAAHQEVAHAAKEDAARRVAAADRLADARRRLLDRATAAGGGAGACAASAAGSAPAVADAVVPADMLRRVAEAAGELAAAADERRTAGLACQRVYESLTTPTP